MLAAIKTISPVIDTTKHVRSNVDIMCAIPVQRDGIAARASAPVINLR